ncbi:HTH DNA-binding protein [Lachnospiraceae bacterium KM106-2]|nr:HTH DNA-binding protein [Lachnospiraceae bacterium KM106-2]
MFQINLGDTDNRKVVEKKDNITIFEYDHDLSVDPGSAIQSYYASKMNVRRRQAMFELNENHQVILQAGAMQWMAGDVSIATNIKGVGDFAKKFMSSKVTGETTVKPRYVGNGIVMLEPTYKHLLIEDVSKWDGMVVDDGLFLACDANVDIKTVARNSFSSAIAGGEGLFNSCLVGNGLAVLESRVPREELVEINLQNDILKIDGNFAIAWSRSLNFTVERTTKTLVGSAASGEGLVNVYRGTGKVLMAPL